MADRVPLAPIGPIERNRQAKGPTDSSSARDTTSVEVGAVPRTIDDDLRAVDGRRYDDMQRQILEG